LKEQLNPKFIVGFTDTETVMLDFDGMPFRSAKYWAERIRRRFRLGGFLIMKSSENNYHVVFDRPVSWAENMSIVAWAALTTHSRPLERWLVMQCIKKSSTLRVSKKGKKPSPRIVFSYGTRDRQVFSFQKHRRLIKNIIKRSELNQISEEIPI